MRAAASDVRASRGRLTDLRRRDELRQAIASAGRGGADPRRGPLALVDAAWAVARNLSPELSATEVEPAVRARTKALGDHRHRRVPGRRPPSADLAAAERDRRGARARADRPVVLERITTDLPEALELLAEAERMAQEEAVALANARARTREVVAQIEQWVSEARTTFTALRDEAAPWHTDDGVVAQLGMLDQSARAFGEDQTEAGGRAIAPLPRGASTDAAEVVPNAEAALGRAKEKKRQLDVVVEAVRRAIGTAESAAALIVEAQQGNGRAVDAVKADLARIVQTQGRLEAALAERGAREEAAANATLHLRELVSDARKAQAELEQLVGRARAAASGDEARRLSARSTELQRSVERLVEQAAEVEAKGVAAAEREARTRAEAHEQRIADLRQRGWDQAARAKAAVDKVDAALAAAGRRVNAHRSEIAVQRFEQASRMVEAARAQVADVDAAAEQAGAATDVVTIEGLEDRARKLAEQLASDCARASQVVEEALDFARAAAEEAEALESVREEVASIVAKADDAVERARAAAARIPSVVRDSGVDPAPLVEETAQHVQAATKAAAKVRAAVPLAGQADTLPVAQSILRTARLALERADTSADAVTAVVDRATERVREEREATAQKLATARAEAAAPGEDAAAAARKAEGWLEAGRREAETHRADAATAEAFRVLEENAAAVRTLAEAVAAEVEAVEQADPAALAALASRIRASADETRAAADKTR
ncbi:MAG: hypothetical protein R3F59_38535, partial [Myxococcota bacterium]